MILNDLEPLLRLLGRLPGVGPRSARRLALELIQNKEALMRPLAQSLLDTADAVRECSACGNLDTEDPCRICLSPTRLGEDGKACVWKPSATCGRWRSQLQGPLSRAWRDPVRADGRGPDQLRVGSLLERVRRGEAREVILALSATVDGQTTAHYLAERLRELGAEVSAVAQGVPVGGSLEYLDDGTLLAAMNARRSV